MSRPVTPPDPALALLAECFGSEGWYADPEVAMYHAEQFAATEPGTRLLAALRSGLAVERLANAVPLGYHFVVFPPFAPSGAGWEVAIGMGIAPWHAEGYGPTLPDAVAAALDEPTGAAQEERA